MDTLIKVFFSSCVHCLHGERCCTKDRLLASPSYNSLFARLPTHMPINQRFFEG
ncbi:hypothetical protein SCLCIDRAFT_686524 [Scleroderma citrinum Foug A]|uniref:Uncharacterized protein n=1 Tax=Scleroderma citrinum Foug A TaxID=1036808 RepID=A0A0C3D3S3_9AGAM|nr:hypothetical protein SCLCIDRAFT_686524 [Scleroderma citrinum Foug A]